MRSRILLLSLLGLLALLGAGCGSPYVRAVARIGEAALKNEVEMPRASSSTVGLVVQEPESPRPPAPRWVPVAGPSGDAEEKRILLIFFRA